MMQKKMNVGTNSGMIGKRQTMNSSTPESPSAIFPLNLLSRNTGSAFVTL